MHREEFQTNRALPAITIAASDYPRLLALAESAAGGMPQVSDYLARELSRAAVVADEQFAADVVRIGSRVTYRDGLSGLPRTVVVVWPHEADMERGLLAVRTPIGAALLGMSPGQAIEWPSPVGGPRTLTVLAVSNGTAPLPAA